MRYEGMRSMESWRETGGSMTDERCMSCRYFEREGDMIEDVDKGLCKRYPPTAGYDPRTDAVVTCWPMVDWTDRCGEWVRE